MSGLGVFLLGLARKENFLRGLDPDSGDCETELSSRSECKRSSLVSIFRNVRFHLSSPHRASHYNHKQIVFFSKSDF